MNGYRPTYYITIVTITYPWVQETDVRDPHVFGALQAIAYTEQLKISMPKWLLDKDQVGTVVGGVSWVGSRDPWESWNLLIFQISDWIRQRHRNDVSPQVLDD